MSYDAKMKNLSWLTVVLLAVAGSGFAFIPTANEELTALEDRPVSLETAREFGREIPEPKGRRAQSV